jgi:hypothetical protein
MPNLSQNADPARGSVTLPNPVTVVTMTALLTYSNHLLLSVELQQGFVIYPNIVGEIQLYVQMMDINPMVLPVMMDCTAPRLMNV